MIDEKYQYFAFISYKREDEEWAKWLQHKLEHYKLPSNLNGRTDLPKEIRPVFKDTSELMPGNLPEQIHQALELSKYLIVICSPRSANSEWVNKEIETFISMGRTANVIPFIIDGKAFADNSEDECFPLALRQLPKEQEILGANINDFGSGMSVNSVVAGISSLLLWLLLSLASLAWQPGYGTRTWNCQRRMSLSISRIALLMQKRIVFISQTIVSRLSRMPCRLLITIWNAPNMIWLFPMRILLRPIIG